MNSTSKLPPGIKLSPHLMELADRFIPVQLFGRNFYIAGTPHVRRLLGIDPPTGRTWRREHDAEAALRDIVSSLELQVRDNVLAGIQERVTETLLGEMRGMMGRRIEADIQAHTQSLLSNETEPQH